MPAPARPTPAAPPALPAVSVAVGRHPAARSNVMGMRPMQERVWQSRGEPYLLIKSPPASGKSRALMFVALDKLRNQGLSQAIILVPERTIGSSFADEDLTGHGFFADWRVQPRWNLCNAPGDDNPSGGKVAAVEAFLASGDGVLVCTHATFRFAFEQLGVEAFDGRLIAVDEFHHVSASPDNRLGDHVRQLIERDRVHLVAMTGSYFRGDAAAVLHPEDESRFATVTYTYHEQLGGYEHLKQLDIGYFFYSGSWAEGLLDVLDPDEKTILHIPNVNSRESTKDKHREVEHVLDALGTWKGVDEATGFHLIERPDGRVLRVADLVDDEPARREKVAAALKDPTQKHNRGHVDLIIALGMAKEGFDWVWCEHALTVGYRSSLTEVVQIIGRATRDAEGKTRARFTNLIAEPDASEQRVTEAVNDTLKAIAASLLMEQVLAPRFEFRAKAPGVAPRDGFDYGEKGWVDGGTNVGVDPRTGTLDLQIKGLAEPSSPEAKRICEEEVSGLVARFLQDARTVERGMFDQEVLNEELNIATMGRIVEETHPDLEPGDAEAVRQRAVAAMNLLQAAKKKNREEAEKGTDSAPGPNTSLLDGIRRLALDVVDLDVDFIDRIDPFGDAYAVLSKTMNEASLKELQGIITAKKLTLRPEEARALARQAKTFKQQHGRLPELTARDPWERRMAEGIAFLVRMKRNAG